MSSVLTVTKAWKRAPSLLPPVRQHDLTDEEVANVKKAIKILRVRLGSLPKLAAAMGVKEATLGASTARSRRCGAGLALRVARLAGVPFEDLIGGRWPVDGACPHCGRTG